MSIEAESSVLVLPHGTVSLNLDRERGVLRIFASPGCHRDDWAVAQSVARAIARGPWDFFMDEGTDIFEVRLTCQGAVA